MNFTTPLTNAAHRVTERLSHLASDALRSTRGSLFAIGTQVLDAMLDRIASFVGEPEGDTTEATLQHEPLEQAVHGKAAGKKRKQARMAMQQLIKAAKRTPQAAYRRRQR